MYLKRIKRNTVFCLLGICKKKSAEHSLRVDLKQLTVAAKRIPRLFLIQWDFCFLKAEAFKNVFETTVTSKFNNIEKLLKNNKGGKGYLVGDKVSMRNDRVWGSCVRKPKWKKYRPQGFQHSYPEQATQYTSLYQIHIFRRSLWFPAVSSPVILVSTLIWEQAHALTFPLKSATYKQAS